LFRPTNALEVPPESPVPSGRLDPEGPPLSPSPELVRSGPKAFSDPPLPRLPVRTRRCFSSRAARLNSRGSLLQPASFFASSRRRPLRRIRTSRQVQPTRDLDRSPGQRRSAARSRSEARRFPPLFRLPGTRSPLPSGRSPEGALPSRRKEHRTEPGAMPKHHKAPRSRSTSPHPTPGRPGGFLPLRLVGCPKATSRSEAPDPKTGSARTRRPTRPRRAGDRGCFLPACLSRS
jgi:hypothetical protein